MVLDQIHVTQKLTCLTTFPNCSFYKGPQVEGHEIRLNFCLETGLTDLATDARTANGSILGQPARECSDFNRGHGGHHSAHHTLEPQSSASRKKSLPAPWLSDYYPFF